MSRKGKFKIFYQNVNGLKTKLSDVKSEVETNDYDVIVMCETWLREGFYDNELFDDRYTIHRRDRNFDITTKLDGGGCIVAVKRE